MTLRAFLSTTNTQYVALNYTKYISWTLKKAAEFTSAMKIHRFTLHRPGKRKEQKEGVFCCSTQSKEGTKARTRLFRNLQTQSLNFFFILSTAGCPWRFSSWKGRGSNLQRENGLVGQQDHKQLLHLEAVAVAQAGDYSGLNDGSSRDRKMYPTCLHPLDTGSEGIGRMKDGSQIFGLNIWPVSLTERRKCQERNRFGKEICKSNFDIEPRCVYTFKHLFKELFQGSERGFMARKKNSKCMTFRFFFSPPHGTCDVNQKFFDQNIESVKLIIDYRRLCPLSNFTTSNQCRFHAVQISLLATVTGSFSIAPTMNT